MFLLCRALFRIKMNTSVRLRVAISHTLNYRQLFLLKVDQIKFSMIMLSLSSSFVYTTGSEGEFRFSVVRQMFRILLVGVVLDCSKS